MFSKQTSIINWQPLESFLFIDATTKHSQKQTMLNNHIIFKINEDVKSEPGGGGTNENLKEVKINSPDNESFRLI